jgi:hypothetical protein
MQITRNRLDTGTGPNDWFTGSVYIDPIAAPAGSSRLRAPFKMRSGGGV